MDIVQATPELQSMQERSKNLEEEIAKKIEQAKEEVAEQVRAEVEAASSQAADNVRAEIEEQVAEAQRAAEKKMKEEMAKAQKEAETKIKAEIEAGREQAAEEIRNEIEQAQRQAQARIEEEIKKAQLAAKVQLMEQQRESSLELMKLMPITNPNKLKYSMKYYALLDFQIQEESEKHELASVQRYLKDISYMLPNLSYIKVSSEYGSFYPSHVEIKSESLEEMFKDELKNVMALSIGMDIVNPMRVGAQEKSFYDIIVRGLKSEITEVPVRNVNHADELVMNNAQIFIFLLQARHNSLVNAVIATLDDTPFSFKQSYTVTGEGLDVEKVNHLIKMLQGANKTKSDLSEMGITPMDFKDRSDKLKKIKLKLKSDIDEDLREAIHRLYRLIKG